MPIDSGNLALKGLDDLFSTEENRQEEQREQVQQIPIDELHPFTNHPFKVLDDEAMTRTVESIAQYGVLAPLIARPRPEGGKGKSGGPISGIEKGPAEETDRPIRREARTPKTIIQLYGILKDPSVTEYAGHDAQELIVDKSTINYHRNHTLDHPAMVVCKRCTPPQKIKGRLADEGIYPRSLTFRAPYAAPQKQKDIYYVLVCNTRDDRNTILNAITKDSAKGGENKPDDKYLAMAAWSPYIETDKICAYIGHLPSTGCFHRLPPRYDCDQE